MSGVTKGIATFYLAYWLLCLDGHTFVLALVLELLAWALVERSLEVARSLLTSSDALYGRC